MIVFRTGDLVFIAIMICAAVVTYKIKYEAQKCYREVWQLERQIAEEKDTISLLRTDWALLTQPARIQSLTAQYKDQLGLQIIEPWQMIKVTDIPELGTVQNIIRNRAALVAPRIGHR